MSQRILIISTEFGTERDEIVVPMQKLRTLGHTVVVATPSGDDVQTVVGDKDWDMTVPADHQLSEVLSDEWDFLLLPGGTVNSDQTRLNDDVRELLKKQAAQGRGIAAICHAPWSLIDAGIARDKNMTSYISVKTDVENAGAHWVDVPAKVCESGGWTLISSRNPGDLDAFVDAIDHAQKG